MWGHFVEGWDDEANTERGGGRRRVEATCFSAGREAGGGGGREVEGTRVSEGGEAVGVERVRTEGRGMSGRLCMYEPSTLSPKSKTITPKPSMPGLVPMDASQP